MESYRKKNTNPNQKEKRERKDFQQSNVLHFGYGYKSNIRRIQIRIGYQTDINMNTNIFEILNKNIIYIIGK
jgi:hypothetical protein